MEVEGIEAALTLAGEILEREPPFNRHEKNAYIKTVKAAFEKVKKARADGFSFNQICAAFEKAGLLPREPRPNSFRQAFYRESERQRKVKDLSKQILGAESEKQTTALPTPALPAKPETSKADWLRKESGHVVDTGLGKIVKHTDGSFDYD